MLAGSLPPPPPQEFVTNETVEIKENVWFRYEITRYPSSATIYASSNNLTFGITTESWNLNFGEIPLGKDVAGIKRFVIISNSRDDNVYVELKAYGNISKIVTFSENNFVLKPNETINVEIKSSASNETIPGIYVGEIDVIVKIPKFSFI